MGSEAVRKGHLFLLGAVPRGKRLSTGEGPPWDCKQAPLPHVEIHQVVARPTKELMVESLLPPTLCWDHPGFCPREARVPAPHSGITPTSRLHRPQERMAHLQNRTSMAGGRAGLY